jgi:hypothetical protein
LTRKGVEADMEDLFNEISACIGYGNCFGRAFGRKHKKQKPKPIIFSNGSNYENNGCHRAAEERRRGKESLKAAFRDKKSVPYRLKYLLGDEFQTSVESESGIFYWTHYIKCSGEFRRIKCDVDACANAHLKREIEFIKPSLIICVGGKAAPGSSANFIEVRKSEGSFCGSRSSATSQKLSWMVW